jgi:hypothetical protein
MGTRSIPATQHPRMRRWLAWLVVVVVLLGAYAIALRWVTLRVESGVQASIHPAVVEGPPRAPE